MSRTANVIRNIKFAIIGQGLGIVINFIARKVFVMTLSAEYLGISGLFTNILSILSLSELGVGTALVFSMYKPVAEENNEKLKSLMLLYKRIYMMIGSFILVAGLGICPFLNFFIGESITIQENLYVIYIMYVVNSGVSYFFTYKRSLIIANQRRDIVSIYRYGMNIVMNALQIMILLTTRNYYLFLFVMILNTVAENVFLSIKADKMFPYLKEKNIRKLENDEMKEIKKNVFAMLFHKIGGVVVTGTDNMLISKFVGIVEVGIYSNYALVINAVNTIISMLFSNITASFGNLNTKEDTEKKLETFDIINFATFIIIGISASLMVAVFNPFISVWVGREYCLDMPIVIILVVNFYLRNMRNSILMAKEAMGLFWDDRFKPLAEAGINLIASIVLGKAFGMIGVFIGTTISWVTVNLWVEPLVLYKNGFKQSSWKYFKNYFIYLVQTVVITVIVFKISVLFTVNGFIDLIIFAVVCLGIIFVMILGLNFKKKELKKFTELIKSYIKK